MNMISRITKLILVAAISIPCLSSCMTVANNVMGKAASSNENASAPFAVDVKAGTNPQVFKLQIKKPAGERVWIYLYAPDKQLLDRWYSDKNSIGVEVPFNFTGAAEGEYIIEVSGRNNSITKKITLTREAIEPVVNITVD
jgi:hypothetical protein